MVDVERVVTVGEDALPIELPLSVIGLGVITGQTVTLKIRDGSTSDMYLDFDDFIFKNSGWNILSVTMAEFATPGIYRYLLDTNSSTDMKDGFICVCEMTVAGDYAGLWTENLYFKDPAGGGGGAGSGDGSVSVDHNTGGTDALRYRTSLDVGINNAVIRAFLKTDYDAGNRTDLYVKAYAMTNVNGRWVSPMFLDPAIYSMVFELQGQYGPDKVDVTVA